MRNTGNGSVTRGVVVLQEITATRVFDRGHSLTTLQRYPASGDAPTEDAPLNHSEASTTVESSPGVRESLICDAGPVACDAANGTSHCALPCTVLRHPSRWTAQRSGIAGGDTDADPTLESADAGMSTVEYAVGTVVAAAFAAVLYKIVTGDSVVTGLTNLINSALSTTF